MGQGQPLGAQLIHSARTVADELTLPVRHYRCWVLLPCARPIFAAKAVRSKHDLAGRQNMLGCFGDATFVDIDR